MTIEEKAAALNEYCYTRTCSDCPLYEAIPSTEACLGEDADIERNYSILFGNSKPATGTVNHPGHYNREGGMECIDEMLLIFGKEAVMHFCLCNAWKYRYRAADKNGAEDMKKSDWYLAKYKELQSGA